MLYVFEAPADLFDDWSMDPRIPLDDRVSWMGEQATDIALRAMTKPGAARFLSMAEVDLRENVAAIIPPQGGSRFSFTAKARLSRDGKHVTLEYSVTRHDPREHAFPLGATLMLRPEGPDSDSLLLFRVLRVKQETH